MLDCHKWDSVSAENSEDKELPRRAMVTKRKGKKRLKALELFAGAGGLALGIHQAGFKCVGLLEWDSFAVETLKENSRRVLELSEDLVIHRDVNDPEIDYKKYSGEVDLVSGGPPCQPFSTSGLSRGDVDDRNLFPSFLNIISIVRPPAIIVENVRGLLRPKFQDYFGYILKRLEFPLSCPSSESDWKFHYQKIRQLKIKDFGLDEQYEVGYQSVDAADYGVPQRRNRVLITAFRRDTGLKPIWLPPSHSRIALLADQWVTNEYWKRHQVRPRRDHLIGSDLWIIKNLQNDLFAGSELAQKPWVTVRDAISDLEEPVPRGKKPKIPNHIQHPGARIYRCHIGSYLDFPAKALKAGTNGTPGGENVLRYSPIEGNKSVRYFTTREAARLQGFPDNWHFHGTWGACIKQLGNAVPVELGRLYAKEIARQLLCI